MQFIPWTAKLTEADADCLIVFVDTDSEITSSHTAEIESLANFKNLIAKLEKPANSVLFCPIDSAVFSSTLLYRTPKRTDSADKWRDFANKLSIKTVNLNAPSALIDLSAVSGMTDVINPMLEICLAIQQQRYRFEDFKSKKKPARKLEKLVLTVNSDSIEADVNQGIALGQSINLCRDLGNMPGNACTPKFLAEKAQSFEQDLKIETEILDEDQMQELGMGSLLSVSAGSDEPAQLIVMRYQGAEKDVKPYALVGKGITFDTGGISLKPGAGMDEMKFDMCGAASVFGAVHAVAKLKLPINLVAVVAAAENMPSGRATKPGDVVTSMSGQTIEVLNTDAEGRLVLCDALTYVAEKYNPETIIDIATLTGACVIALGSHASAVYANDEKLAEDILYSAEQSGDKAWRMPLWAEYDKQLESNFADMANIGGREAGSVTAACFLARYTKGQKWAHLDIAGTAWKSGKAKGATGRPVRLLVDYLQNRT